MAKRIMDSGLERWTPKRLPELGGRRYFITGANSGIGLEAAKILRRNGADVIVGSRSPERGAGAVEEIAAVSAPGAVDLVQIDLADTSSIRAVAERISTDFDGLDAVVNNAGVMQTPRLETADGFELQFGTNHLGHFLLNGLLYDAVLARGGRMVTVSSIVALRAPAIDFDDPMLTRSYSPTRAYLQSKLANLTYALELQRRLEAAGSEVSSIACHPGYSATNLQSRGPTGLLKGFYKITNALMAQPAERGAAPEVLAAAGREALPGAYYGPTGLGETRGALGDAKVSDHACDPVAGERLWTLSEELLGYQWDL